MFYKVKYLYNDTPNALYFRLYYVENRNRKSSAATSWATLWKYFYIHYPTQDSSAFVAPVVDHLLDGEEMYLVRRQRRGIM